MTTIDQLVAQAKLLNGAGVLFASGPEVLLAHRADPETWGLPSSDDIDVHADGAISFGDALLARCDAKFEPKPEHFWIRADFALTCALDSEAATAVQQFLAAQGDSQLGDLNMDSSRKEFLDAQAAAEPTYRAFNDSAPAQMQGESLPDYESRLVRPYQQFSKPFKDADLAKIGCPIARRALASQIYKDALQEAEHPTALSLRPGELRAIVRNDAAGRPITRRVAADDGAYWDRINPPVRYVRNPLWLRMAPGR
jgi:hypothetical protein